MHYGLTDGWLDGWMDRQTDGWTDGRTEKASYRVACPQLKTKRSLKSQVKNFCQYAPSFQAWQMMSILKDLVEKEKYEKDNDKKYAEQLRLVADELLRAAHQIENPHADEIK